MSKPCCQRNSSPFKGEVGRGMGAKGRISSLPDYPIPTPTLPLKGRERVPRSGMCIAGNHLSEQRHPPRTGGIVLHDEIP